MQKRKPPVRKLRPDRRVSFIVPPDLVPAVNADLKAGWAITELIVAALRLTYQNTVADDGEGRVATRNGQENAQK